MIRRKKEEQITAHPEKAQGAAVIWLTMNWQPQQQEMSYENKESTTIMPPTVKQLADS